MASGGRRLDLLAKIAASQPPDTQPARAEPAASPPWPEPDAIGGELLALGLRRTGPAEYAWTRAATGIGTRFHLIARVHSPGFGHRLIEWRFAGLDDEWIDHPLVQGSRVWMTDTTDLPDDAVRQAQRRLYAQLQTFQRDSVHFIDGTVVALQRDIERIEVGRWFGRYTHLAAALVALDDAKAALAGAAGGGLRSLRTKRLMASLFGRPRPSDAGPPAMLPGGTNRLAVLSWVTGPSDSRDTPLLLSGLLAWALPRDARASCAAALLALPPSRERSLAAGPAAATLLTSHDPRLVAYGVRLASLSSDAAALVRGVPGRVGREAASWVSRFETALEVPLDAITSPLLEGALAISDEAGGALSIADEVGALSWPTKSGDRDP